MHQNRNSNLKILNTFKTDLSLSPENYTLKKPTSRATDLYHIEQYMYFKVKVLLLVREEMWSYVCVIHTAQLTPYVLC